MATESLKNLHKKLGSYVALEGVSLEIAEREFLVLLGPSGCGKTPTMRMVAGLEQPTWGETLIDGERINEVGARHRDLAMVFQSYGRYPHMTVRENIAYPLKVRGMPPALRHEMAELAAGKAFPAYPGDARRGAHCGLHSLPRSCERGSGKAQIFGGAAYPCRRQLQAGTYRQRRRSHRAELCRRKLPR